MALFADLGHYDVDMNGKALMTAATEGWKCTRMAGSLGLEIRNFDLSKATPADAKIVSELLVDNAVLFFPEQKNLTEESHQAFGRLFGNTAGHPNLPNANKGEMLQLKAERRAAPGEGGMATLADEWHTDLTCEENPPVASILRMVKCPRTGGDTMFSSLAAAYEALSPPLKALCDGLTALHDANTHDRPEKMTVHPVVRKHPVSGKKCLYVNRVFTKRIVEMSHDESRLLLDHLIRHITDPRFTVRYSWSQGDVVMWDNRQTQHCAVNDFNPEEEGTRLGHRVTVQGDTPEAGAPEAQGKWAPFPGRHQDDRPLIKYLRSQGKMSGGAKL